jgi:hypothetical protein
MRALALFLCFSGCLRATLPRATTPKERAGIAVVVVLDQLGSWVLAHHLPYLSEGGVTQANDGTRGLLSQGRVPICQHLHLGGTYQAAVEAATRAIAGSTGIEMAVPTQEATRWLQDPSPIRQVIARSVSLGAGGDIFVLPAMYSVIGDEESPGSGTSHGSYWSYDTQVPVLIAGPGVPNFKWGETVSQARVAATISALLGVSPLSSASPEVLPRP